MERCNSSDEFDFWNPLAEFLNTKQSHGILTGKCNGTSRGGWVKNAPCSGSWTMEVCAEYDQE